MTINKLKERIKYRIYSKEEHICEIKKILNREEAKLYLLRLILKDIEILEKGQEPSSSTLENDDVKMEDESHQTKCDEIIL